MGSIKLPHASGNSVSIAAPQSNPASDRTLYLPSNADGTVLTNTTPGCILQVVHSMTNTEVGVDSNSFTDIGLSASITPASSSNKILCLAQVQARVFIGTADNGFSVQLVRDSTSVPFSIPQGYQVGYNNASIFNSTSEESYLVPVHHLDSPSTTSAITYKIQGRCRNSTGGNEVDFQDDGNFYSTLTLLEVAG